MFPSAKRSRMDNTCPSPPKRPRTHENLTVQLGKKNISIQIHGPLSTDIEQSNSTRVERIPGAKCSLSMLPYANNMKFVPNKEMSLTTKLQKLKLKSPDGRDLGEIEVKLFPQKCDGIKGKTIMLKKHSMFGKLENSSTAVSILKPMDRIKVESNGRVSPQMASTHGHVQQPSKRFSIANVSSIKFKEATSQSQCLANPNPEQKSMILRHPDNHKHPPIASSSQVFLIHVDKQNGLNNIKNMHKDVRNLSQPPPKQKIVMVRAENYPYSNDTKKKTSSSTVIELRNSASHKDQYGTESISIMPSTENSNISLSISGLGECKTKGSNQSNMVIKKIVERVDKPTAAVRSLADSKPLTVTRKSSNPPSNLLQINFQTKLKPLIPVKTYSRTLESSKKNSNKVNERESVTNSIEATKTSVESNTLANTPNLENTQYVTSPTNNVTLTDGSKEGIENSVVITQHTDFLQVKARPSCTDKVNTGFVDKDKGNNGKNLGKNMMVILPKDVDMSSINERNDAETSRTSIETSSMEIDRNTNATRNAVTIEETALNQSFDVESPNQSVVLNGISSMSATTSPKRQDLDIIEKALSTLPDQVLREKALKALADCGIGLKRDVPVPPTVSVSDSETQTTVFSLLEPKTFLEYNENLPTLKRLEVNQISDTILQLQHENRLLPGCTQQWTNNACVNTQTNVLPEDFLDFCNDFLDEPTSSVHQIQKVLSKPDIKISKIVEQLQKDFQAATSFDNQGMMGIHRAVLSENITEVRRQLIVLKAVKQSVDVLTECGKTSLELAVEHDIEPVIVEILLKAGAKPAFSMKLHESALIMACKMSSTVLPQLISHVDSPSLLDNMDSEGFAPLHYCAQLGNVNAVKQLISAGANINLRDAKSGRTAIFHALDHQYIPLAWYLIENRASTTITNFAGQSPAGLVDEHKHNTLAEKLNQEIS
ncbi:uncharacterized protein LOC124302605 isoform X1 [Neodiprion virginianus]|uniref:uncharacterized protein LOC124302605 isoform X1 n=2 Tax=Neodiprion virginianus TaxID=2961670 RepID=UPI001EE73CD7|nr:uncharacterized protein LOC124302605 isoform X1 [Neodiprion virginianus]